MPKSKNFLPDVNFWLALSTSAHVHHESSVRWFEAQTDTTSYFCRITQMGLLRLLTQPKVMGGDVLSFQDAWKTYDAVREDFRISFREEPESIEVPWRTLIGHSKGKHLTWTDAYLAAFATASDLQVVTFDKKFPANGHPVQILN